jgi:hypothetical protein
MSLHRYNTQRVFTLTLTKTKAIYGTLCIMSEPCAPRPLHPRRRHPHMASNRRARILLVAVAAAAVLTTTVATPCRPCAQRLHLPPTPRRTPDVDSDDDAAVLARLELTVQRVARFLKLWSENEQSRWGLRQLFPFEFLLCHWILVRRSDTEFLVQPIFPYCFHG